MDSPLAFTLVHAQQDTGIGGWMVDGSIQEKKIRSELGHRKRSSIDQQAHSHVGGMPFVTGG